MKTIFKKVLFEGFAYLIHSKSIAARTDKGDEPKRKRVSIRNEYLDEVEAAH